MKTQQIKTANKYIQIYMDYGKFIVLPFNDGVRFLESLEQGEMMIEKYGEDPIITPISKDFKFNFLSEEEYKEAKLRGTINGNGDGDTGEDS